MAENPHYKELLQALNDYEVEYLIVGGYAVMKYTEPRYTKDLDVWVHNSPHNSVRLFEALVKLGFIESAMARSRANHKVKQPSEKESLRCDSRPRRGFASAPAEFSSGRVQEHLDTPLQLRCCSCCNGLLAAEQPPAR